MELGRKIYYDNTTGKVLVDLGEGAVTQTTIEQDIATYKVLSERNRNTFSYIDLPFGAYAQDFATCTGYRIDVETKLPKFSYPTGGNPIEPVYVKPLTEQLADLKERQAFSEEAIDFLLMSGGLL